MNHKPYRLNKRFLRSLGNIFRNRPFTVPEATRVYELFHSDPHGSWAYLRTKDALSLGARFGFVTRITRGVYIFETDHRHRGNARG